MTTVSDVQVTIGPCAEIPVSSYRAIDWSNSKKAIKDLLVAVFSREVLGRSSLTGGRSNANAADAALRPALDQVKLNDVLSELLCIIFKHGVLTRALLGGVDASLRFFFRTAEKR